MESPHSNDAKSLGHEPLEADVRAVSRTGVGLAVLVVGSFLLVYGLMRFYAALDDVSSSGRQAESVVPSSGVPKLDVDQPVELQALRTKERQILSSYGWVDRAAGVAHIPIERAMQIIAAEGLPVTPPAVEPPPPAGGNPP